MITTQEDLKLIWDDWGCTHRLTKIYIKEDYLYFGLDQKESIIKAGFYFITGFWGDAMGLSDTLQGARETDNKWVIPSRALMFFYRGVGI